VDLRRPVLVVKGDKLGEFSIAGGDRKWYWAGARIKGNTVILSLSALHPAQVRYAWQSNPEATLFNGAGLPAAPFRTDDWPSMTQNARPYRVQSEGGYDRPSLPLGRSRPTITNLRGPLTPL
jgi:hypothetical protein